MEARIPFSGFYNSIWDAEIDECIQRDVEQLAEEHGVGEDDVLNLIYKHATFREAHQGIARYYVEAFERHLREELELDIKLEFSIMTSPREYNFETDRIFVKLSLEDLQKAYDVVGPNAIACMARGHLTSRDGFVSFYDPDISTWGPLETWDYNQAYMIFLTLWDLDEDAEYKIFEALLERIFNEYAGCVDWTKFEEDLAELLSESRV